MVADEVATGIGATGRWWAVEHAGVAPDLLVAGKRVTGGYLPLSAVLATKEIYRAFLDGPGDGAGSLANRTFFHGHTFTANPLCCAAALANLRLMHERSTVDRAALVGERVGALLAPLQSYDAGGPPDRHHDPDRAVRAAVRCAEHGVRVGCFRAPSVPVGRSCLRVTGRADLGPDEIARAEAAFAALAAT
jgi:hypothetical protein